MSSSAQHGGRFNPLDTLHNRGPSAWMRGLPYLALLNEYFKLYLPVDGSNRSSTNDSDRNNNNGAVGDSANKPLASTSTGATRSHNLVEQTALEAQHAQLFVHLAVAYWVDCALVLRREHGQLGLWRRLLTNVSSGLTGVHPHLRSCLSQHLFLLCILCCVTVLQTSMLPQVCNIWASGHTLRPWRWCWWTQPLSAGLSHPCRY